MLFCCGQGLEGFLLEQWRELLEEIRRILEEKERLLELRLLLKFMSEFLSSNRAEKHTVWIILEQCCGILENVQALLEKGRKILEQSELILAHRPDILENRHFIRTY